MEDDRQRKLSDYAEGDTFRGDLITNLYTSNDEFLIYEGNDSGKITLATNVEEIKRKCSAISAQIARISGHLLTVADRRLFVDQIALAYREIIMGNSAEALKICASILEDIKAYKSRRELGRIYYLSTCLVAVLTALLLAYLLKRYAVIPEILPHYYFMAYASVGGFLSVAKDINQIEVTSTEFGRYQMVYGGIRILIAMFSGLIVYVAIESKMVLPQLADADNFYIPCILAIAAGFSESLVPNLLKKVEGEPFPATLPKQPL